eukprot:CAMPEP_0181326138 /NCGR_PEP_ID=MMETSP1101-20121128/21320_1 /TAXON_ID=46948 /ORGANISM="Rhodomonas abbreviata, Strain Caron Lab Isolate" /LENGTH=270 /DNA_ID=CAMNT_0023434535 /DNA_START=39 /DNA_END=851 /DNA_ORIENTATION=+
MLPRLFLVALMISADVYAFHVAPSSIALHRPALQATSTSSLLAVARERRTVLRMAGEDSGETSAVETKTESAPTTTESATAVESAPKKSGSQQFDLKKGIDKSGAGFNQFDPVLSATSFVSRRFGLVGGLAAVALLASTEGKEIVEALFAEGPKKGTGEVFKTESGVSYTDILVGPSKGASPAVGKLVGMSIEVGIADQKFKKNVAFKFGQRPFQNVVCQGLEDGLVGMKVGGQRKMTIPVELGPAGIKLPPGIQIVYDVTLNEVFDNYL